MSLRAGRVGINPTDVDPITGHVNPVAVDSYTKSQADDKFLTKSDGSSTYETKSAAADLQPKTLADPIVMLSGTKTTVEDALQGLNTLTKQVVVDDQIESEYTTPKNKLFKYGNVVTCIVQISAVTGVANDEIATVPTGYRPATEWRCIDVNGKHLVQIGTDGAIKLGENVTSQSVFVYTSWPI